ncbi:MAG: Fructose-26-bisphosphatase [Candidatus Saccharibacteria bacterium]|nr:Fructose-26-bisphosphatase [Candidatus Saccharibacteria bacterium]
MKRLYFVRHGLSVMNQQGIFSGRTETPLAPEGIEQCKHAAQEAVHLGINAIVTSPMKRAYDTAVIIAGAVDIPAADIISKDLFMERGFGVLEGTAYQADMDMTGIEGVETEEQILARAHKAVEFLNSLPYDTILVVSHGAIGRALRHTLHPEIPFRGSEHFKNAVITQII